MKPTLVFDYDGTIHNTMKLYEPAIRETCNWLLSNKYVKEANPDSKRIASWLGMNVKDMWKDFMPDLDPDIRLQAELMVGEYMMSRVRSHEAQWYPDAMKTLNTLKSWGYRMVILSNSKKITGRTHFKEFDMGRWFDKWYDCESFNWAPKTDIIKIVSSDYPGDLIVIGDRKSDYEAAKAIGAKFIGCLYGYGSEEEMQFADFKIDSIVQLTDCLKS